MIKIVLAIDPGKKKCGIAIVNNELQFIKGEIAENQGLIKKVEIYLKKYNINIVLVGGGTNSREIIENIKRKIPNVSVIKVPEKNSSMQARKRYFDYYPPVGFLKIFPRSFLVPPYPYDDFAALIIAESFFKNHDHKNISNGLELP